MSRKPKSRRVQRRAPRACSPCRRCGGKRTVTTYFDAGDHFSAGPAPESGYRTYPCPECTANDANQAEARKRR
jgi:hypothetical protein